MTVTETKQALGSWEIRLRDSTPKSVLDALTYFGHVAILPGRLNPVQFGDNLLTAARYVGVYRNQSADDERLIRGSGMAYWLGDEDGKGDVLETAVTLSGATFAASVAAVLPPGGAVVAGTINSVAGTYTNKHQWQTPREALNYITETFGAEWRVNGNATLDAGTVAQLYVTTPKTLLMSRESGRDLMRRALAGRMSLETGVEDYTTKVVLLAEGEGTSIATGSASAPTVPYKDLRGNTVRLTRLVSESETPAASASVRAQLALNQFSGKRFSVALSSDDFDVKGDLVVGDYLDVYDPVNGFTDAAREVYWEGQPINPIALRCIELTWPVPPEWTVAFRDINGNWIDLSPYYVGESGETTIVVGDLNRSLSGLGSEDIGVRPNLPDAASPATDTTIPAAPTFTSFSSGAYQSDDRTLAAIQASWATPLNTDSSTITDGDHYEIQYRPSAIIGTQVPWDFLSGGYNLDLDFAFTASSGTAWPGGWSIRWGSASNFSSGAGIANVHHVSTSNLVSQTYGVSYPDAEIVANFRITDTPTGASFVHGISFRRDVTTGTGYHLSVEPNTDGSVTTKLRGHDGTNLFDLVTVKVPGMTHDVTRDYWLRAYYYGGTINCKIWQGVESDEPVQDTITYYTANPYTGGSTARPGIWGYLVGGNTNTLPVTISTTTFKVRSLAPDSPGSAYNWDSLGSWDALTSPAVAVTPNWQTAYVGWGQNTFTLTELSPGIKYEFQIRAVDAASPPHRSIWSASSYVSTTGDVIAPSTPAPPEVAASMIAVQITHRLGKSTGGTFNLEQDLSKLEVHASSSPTYYPDARTKVGELLANGAMVRAGIPAVGTFKVDQADSVWIRVVAVDRTGNASPPSDPVQSTIVLIDDAHISDLTVTKVTAGTITATWIMAGAIKTAETGARVEMTSGGIRAYRPDGSQTVRIDSSDGSATFTGILQTELSGVGITFQNYGNYVYGFWSINDTSTGLPLDHRVRQIGYDSGGVFGQTFDTTIQRRSDSAVDGGKLLLSEQATILSHQPADDTGRPEAFISLGGWPANINNDYGFVYARGKYAQGYMQDGNCLWFSRRDSVGAGFGGLTVVYGPTTTEYMAINVTMHSTASVSYWLGTATATQYTINWSDTLAHTMYSWVVRQDTG